MIKILMFHPWLKSKGGAERLIYEYFSKSKNKIKIVSWYYNRNRSFYFKDLVMIFKKGELLFSGYLARGLISLLLALIKIPIEKFDIFLISSGGISELSLFRTRKKRTPIVIYSHTILRACYKYDIYFNYLYRFRNPIKRFIYKVGIHFYNKLEKLAWKKIDFAIFNSELSRKRTLEKKLINPEKTKIIYPGTDLKGFYNSNPENYFLYVGRFGLAKRQHVLIEAFAKFSKEHPEYKLYLVGGGENKEYKLRLLKLIKKYNLKDKVKILSNVSDEKLKELYAKCLAFVHIPFMEDFGIVPLEAAASGKYIINVFPSGNYEILKDALGIYWIKEKIYDEKMVEEVYKALKYFIENKNKLIELGKKNREFIEKLNLSWDKFSEEVDKTLEEILTISQKVDKK